MSTELKAENVNAKNAGIIFKERLRVLEMVQADDEFYAALLCKYRMDPISFINDWFVTYDPRYKPALMPFVLFPKQKEYIQWLRQRFDNQEDAVVVKTRRVGITYLSVAFAIWLWRFHLGSKIGFGSRKEMLVDRLGDPDSIFEKIRIILKYMPNEFLPPNFNLDRDCKYLKILNPQNDNTITGEAGDNIGRGGGNTIYFKDESAHYERADKIDASLSMNAEIKIDISTPNGTGILIIENA